MAKSLLIIGAGEYADIAYEYFTVDSDYTVVGFAVEAAYMGQASKFGLPVVALEAVEDHFSVESVEVHVAVTSTALNQVRERLVGILRAKGYNFANYISSRAFVWRTAKLGENVFIFENNVVQHGVQVGDGVVLWSGNHIGHQSRIGDFCFVSSHAVVSGYCTIGRRSFLGVNATLADHVSIPADTFVGLASVLNKSFEEPGLILTGNPALASKVSAYRYFKVKP
jgi:sugar O-acyltransferase (sialic acid O-acetyltransferase NeuD family)